MLLQAASSSADIPLIVRMLGRSLLVAPRHPLLRTRASPLVKHNSVCAMLDLHTIFESATGLSLGRRICMQDLSAASASAQVAQRERRMRQIGRASGRERVCQYVSIWV